MTSTFLIGPAKEGLRKDLKPWATPEDSFEVLTNAYQWRGRILKRSGYSALGRLPSGTPVMGLKTREQFGLGLQQLVAFDQTSAYQFNGTTFVPLTVDPGQMTAVWSGSDSDFFFTTNYAAAFWATNGLSGLHGVNIISAIVGLTTVTFGTTNPNNFSDGQTVTIIGVQGTLGADVNGKTFVISGVTPSSFVITLTTSGAYTSGGFALNSQVQVVGQNGIKYYGSLSGGDGWANYNPPIDTENALAGALMMFAYRGYFVFLNTFEGPTIAGIENFGNRARWIQIGTPYYSAPVPVFPSTQGIDPDAGRDDLFGKGGANDAPTNEVIIAAGFVKDILVVYFERSTWRLRFVNNQQNPFVWERLNVELGASCTYSTIIFDKGLMAISNRGIVISDGTDTERFDEKIPEDIFNIRQANNGFKRVQGIRTFRTKLNYWTFPSTESDQLIYPDKVLVFNYDTQNWSYFTDSFTCFGYYYPSDGAQTWEELTGSWASYTIETWDGGTSQDSFETIIAGNQQGYIFKLEQTDGENSPSLAISTIVSSVINSPNNNLSDLSWIKLTSVTGATSSDGVPLDGRNFQVNNPTIDPDNFTISEFEPIFAPNAVGTTYTYTVTYKAIFAGSIQINIGSLVFTDPNLDGVLVEASSLGSGTINYTTGKIDLIFDPAIADTAVYIRCVTQDPTQDIDPVEIIGIYTGDGEITVISGLDIQSKVFNFFKDDTNSRLSKIDFYVDTTANGQFTTNIFADSSDDPANTPLSDNLLSNVVLTSNNPYQAGKGSETIYRLFCDCILQTAQFQFTYSNQQMAVSAITRSDIQILALMITMRGGGRLV